MEALRLITKPVKNELVIQIPESLSGNKEFEVIILPADTASANSTPSRTPNPALKNSVVFKDEMIEPATDDWNEA